MSKTPESPRKRYSPSWKRLNPTPKLMTRVGEIFGISRGVTLGALFFSVAVLAVAVLFFIHSAPSTTITITSGPEGSVFYTNAVKYSKILARQGVKLKILTSQGSLENLQRLSDPSFKVDVGFVPDGLAPVEDNKLVSLGSVSYQPLMVFYRGATIQSLAALEGKRIVIGPVGSGTRSLALTLLKANGIEPGGATTTLLDLPPQPASQALLDGKVDAVFLMGEDASIAILRQLLHTPNIDLLNFSQAEAYTRHFNWLNVITLPQGAIDLGKDIPAHDVSLISPTVELVARTNLHPALSDVLLEAAREVHGRATLMQRQGEFPAPIQHDFPLSADALRFYKSGKSFFYHYLPFWLASLTSRIVVVFIPALVILIPILRFIPQIYRWHVLSQLHRWYRALLAVERELFTRPESKDLPSLLKRLDEIETSVNKMKLPASFADQFYSLRGHIDFVRQIMNRQLRG